MSELIERQAVIDALAKIAREKFNLSDEYNHYLAGLMDGELAIKGLPTVQPEKAQLSQEGTTSDLISRQAVKYLDLFTKTYCRDESATDDLVFRCSDCEFELRPSGKCLVKCMARKLCPDYKDFGSMGDL